MLPSACAGCGRYGQVLCHSCRRSMRPASHRDGRFLAADPGVVMGEAMELAVAAFAFDGPVRRTLQQLKYGGAARLAEPLAAACAAEFGRLLSLTGRAALVPVPVHVSRLRQRGYNQAALLARGLARSHGLPVADVLARVRHTAAQHRLGRAGRLRNLRAAFALAPSVRGPPPAAILVDDILTTSATLEACAAVLLAAGSRRVVGFAVAREV
jgi:ComF family protein